MLNLASFLVWTILFAVFLLGFLYNKKRPEWRSSGMVVGFLIALFAEMFGLPLSIYILSALFGMSGPSESENLRVVLIGRSPLELPFVVGAFVLMIAGFALIILGWRRIYVAGVTLVTDGIYARVRHPQYLGLMMATLGLLLWWPTIPILIMWPVLCLMYYLLAKRDEREMVRAFGDEYLEYRKKVKMLLFSMRPAR